MEHVWNEEFPAFVFDHTTLGTSGYRDDSNMDIGVQSRRRLGCHRQKFFELALHLHGAWIRLFIRKL